MGSGYERPGRGTYVTLLTAPIQHGDITTHRTLVGTAIKQAAYDYDSARGPGRAQIAVGERFFLRMKGIAEAGTATGEQGVDLAAAQVGDAVWVGDGTGGTTRGKLYAAAGGGRLPFGKVFTVAGVHGTAPNTIRVDMDLKDSV